MDPVFRFEIPVGDLERAKKFYEKTFGWKVRRGKKPGANYTVETVEVDEKGVPKTGGAINGRLVLRGLNRPNSPVLIVKVASLKSINWKSAPLLSSKFISMKKEGNSALYARMTDTEGNVIGVWEDFTPKKND